MILETHEPTKKRRGKPIDGRGFDAHAMQIKMGHLEKNDNGRLNTRYQHPLELYVSRKNINQQQAQAGNRLEKDFAIAFGNMSILVRIGEVQGEPADHKVAMDRYVRVMSVLNRTSRWLAKRVIIDGVQLETVHAEMGWAAKNSGMDRLKETLDEIDELYTAMRDGENILDRIKNPLDFRVLHSLSSIP